MKKLVASLALILFVVCVGAETQAGYRISGVTYRITGSTKEYALKLAVPVDTETVFPTKEEMDHYVANLGIRISNQRVFEETSVEATYSDAVIDGIIPVAVTITTKDTLNIIVLPKPSFDSNSGFDFKIKMKNYNFFGSMREFEWDIAYTIDEDDRKSFETSFGFSIPFMAMSRKMVWDIKAFTKFPMNEDPEAGITTGLDITHELSFAELHYGIIQGIAFNDRDDDKQIYDQDRTYLTDTVYVNLPIELHRDRYFGEVTWTPEVSLATNWAPDGIDNDDLKGPDLVLGHSLSFGRVDWKRNFRQGANVVLKNQYTHNFSDGDDSYISVSALAQGYYSFFDRFALASQLYAFHNFSDYVTEDAGGKLRGILDKRVNTDSAIFFNLDLPTRLIRADFKEISGIDWTRYISFELQISPFIDMALTHDLKTDRLFSPEDGWYSGGVEVIAYPMKMRSIFVRASVGFDLTEVIERGKLTGNAKRDGESVHELFIGLGLQY